jgi:hypothetical protein
MRPSKAQVKSKGIPYLCLRAVFITVYQKTPGLNSNSQKIEQGFWEKGNKVCFSDEEEDRESHPLKILLSHF